MPREGRIIDELVNLYPKRSRAWGIWRASTRHDLEPDLDDDIVAAAPEAVSGVAMQTGGPS